MVLAGYFIRGNSRDFIYDCIYTIVSLIYEGEVMNNAYRYSGFTRGTKAKN